MLNNRFIAFLETEITALKRELKEQREFYEEKLQEERRRTATETQIARVREQSLLDRLMAQNGVPQVYGTIEQEKAQANEPGLLPGQSSISYYRQLEDQIWQNTPEDLIRAQAQRAQATLLQELTDGNSN